MEALKLKGWPPATVKVEVAVGMRTLDWAMAVSGWSKLRSKRAMAYMLMLNHEADFDCYNVALRWVGGDSTYTAFEMVEVQSWDRDEAEANPLYHFDPEVQWAGLAYLDW